MRSPLVESPIVQAKLVSFIKELIQPRRVVAGESEDEDEGAGPPPPVDGVEGGWWQVFSSYCVSATGDDLSQTGVPFRSAADQSLTACRAECERQGRSQGQLRGGGCSGIEWYGRKWGGRHCYLILGSNTGGVRAAKGAGGSRWQDATCHVRAA